MKRLYFDQLPFFKTYQETVKRAMLFEDNANYRMGYKTGWGFTENGHALGWVLGWIEENKHPYFFVLNLESPDRDFDMFKIYQIHSTQKNAYRKARSLYTVQRVEEIFEILLEYDLRSKGVNNNEVPHEELLREMVYKIML
jgi:hypothetical protein